MNYDEIYNEWKRQDRIADYKDALESAHEWHRIFNDLSSKNIGLQAIFKKKTDI